MQWVTLSLHNFVFHFPAVHITTTTQEHGQATYEWQHVCSLTLQELRPWTGGRCAPSHLGQHAERRTVHVTDSVPHHVPLAAYNQPITNHQQFIRINYVTRIHPFVQFQNNLLQFWRIHFLLFNPRSHRTNFAGGFLEQWKKSPLVTVQQTLVTVKETPYTLGHRLWSLLPLRQFWAAQNIASGEVGKIFRSGNVHQRS